MAEFKEAPAGAPLGARLTVWFENRFPTAFAEYKKHMSEYYAPKNFNVWYVFGSLALLVLVMQIVTGIFLTMHYKPSAAEASWAPTTRIAAATSSATAAPMSAMRLRSRSQATTSTVAET